MAEGTLNDGNRVLVKSSFSIAIPDKLIVLISREASAQSLFILQEIAEQLPNKRITVHKLTYKQKSDRS